MGGELRVRRAAVVAMLLGGLVAGCLPPGDGEPSPVATDGPTSRSGDAAPSAEPSSEQSQEQAVPADDEAGSRDPLRWPYPADSIWNTAVGDRADLVPLGMELPTGRTLNIEEDLLFLSPDAPQRPLLEHEGGWRDGVVRCDERTGRVLARLPIAEGLTTDPGYHGTKPNHSAAIVLPDLTLFETQPLHVCPDGTVVSQFVADQRDGDSLLTGGQGPPFGGSHGGSGMTAFGGTIRLGEWVPGGRIPHTIKLVVDSAANLAPVEGGYRWPALRADQDWATTYGGTVAEARMGSLLVLPRGFDVAGLASEPARMLADTLVRHGAYVVDETGWSTAAFAVEWSSAGRVRDEFRDAWGFDMVGDVRSADGDQRAFLEDVERIYAALHVVDDNGPDSVGGAGVRLAPAPPPFNGDDG